MPLVFFQWLSKLSVIFASSAYHASRNSGARLLERVDLALAESPLKLTKVYSTPLKMLLRLSAVKVLKWKANSPIVMSRVIALRKV